MTQQVSVIIPNWNGAGYLATALESVAAQTYPIHEIIVVDNGSTDNSIDVAQKAGARVIALAINRGFAYAVNRGIETARGDRLAILNNDVELEPSWLATLVSTEASFSTGKLLSHSGRIDGSYDAVCRGACAWRCGAGRPDGPAWNETRPIHFASFTAVVFRRQVFETIGLLDEDYGSYLEDVDFGFRCAVAGLAGIYIPQARAVHQGSATLGRWHPETVRLIARNQLLLIAKHYPAGWLVPCGWPVAISQLLWGLVALRHGAALPYVYGKLDGLRCFRRMRGTGSPAIFGILENSEREIRYLQQQTGFDPYWKLYFALT